MYAAVPYFAIEDAPRWFGRAIARNYRLPLKHRGQNADRYLRFMGMCRHQVERLGGEERLGKGALKALDEYNCCKFTKGWVWDARPPAPTRPRYVQRYSQIIP